jgi:hypothetical protein
MSRQPPMIKVSRFLQNLAKDKIDSSPTLKQSNNFSVFREDEHASETLEIPLSPTLLHLLISKKWIHRHPLTRTASPQSVTLVQPCRPNSCRFGQFLERAFSTSSVTNLHPSRCRINNYLQILTALSNS